jgi:RNA polymerase sigma-70 factor (ECF subfamily)
VSSVRPVEINEQPWGLLLDPEGKTVVVVSLDIADGLIQSVRAISDPEKLRHLGAGRERPG